MVEEVDTDNAVSSSADRFPFVMVLATTFILGGMFLILNAPLIAIACGAFSPKKACEIQGITTLLSCGVKPFWQIALGMGGGFASSFLFLVLSLLAGLLLTPIDRLSPVIFGRLWMFGRRLVRGATSPPPVEPFSSRMFLTTDQPAFLAILMKDRVAKLHWEWELFHFYIFWSVFNNILAFILLTLHLQLPRISLLEALSYAALFLSFFGYAALKSEGMTRVHRHYYASFVAGQRAAQKQVPTNGSAVPSARHCPNQTLR